MGRAIAGIYGVLVIVFALYGSWFGANSHKGFWYNLGGAMVWPVTFFPSLGELITIVVVLGFLGLVLMRKK